MHRVRGKLQWESKNKFFDFVRPQRMIKKIQYYISLDGGIKMIKMTFVILLCLIFFSFSCHKSDRELDDIKEYKPDDKYFKSNLVTLHFIIETSSISHVDSVYNNLIDLYELPVDAKECPDGVFVGESPYDAYDYKHIIKLEIKNENIINVDYNEIHFKGVGKQEDSLYCAETSITGTTPAIAYPKMENELLSKQNISDLDAVSGATYSLYRFRYATMIALIRAKLSK